MFVSSSAGTSRILAYGSRMTAPALRRGLTSALIVLVAWELASRAPQLIGVTVPVVGVLPPPSAVVADWSVVVRDPGYWVSWYLTTLRVLTGFTFALVVGVLLGLSLAMSRILFGIVFPIVEVLRPIPPIAWVPMSIIFWPTQEMSIGFVIFLGAFYTITLSTLYGARDIDPCLVQSALSMGAPLRTIFARIVFPATLPSIVTGATIGMGITWEVVVAAEMISGSGGGQTGGGLGHLIWDAYIAGDLARIIVGMISIGVAGYVSSALLRGVGVLATPWLRRL